MIRFNIRDLIWLYFWLLIFEGALRKWIVPGLSSPLLIVRDPVVLLIYILALKNGVFPQNFWISGIIIIGLSMFLISLFTEQNNIFVSCYGLRTNILHFPLCFIMAKVIDRNQFEKIGRWIIALILPMGLLMAAQFLASPDSFINTTAGGEGAQIGGTVGNIRPPGTFSFITGAAEFLSLATAILMGFYLSKNQINHQKFIWGALGLMIALSVSISRLALSYIAIVIAMMLIIIFFRPSYLNRIVGVFLISLVLFVGMLNLNFIQQGLNSFSERITAANDVEKETGGFTGRILTDYISPITILDQIPVIGHGLGLGTSAGAKLLTGDIQFVLAEGEWARVIMESGPILGLAFILWRILFTMRIGALALRASFCGYPLPLLIFGACNQLILVGQISRPTTLGFCIFETGLCMAAVRLAQEDFNLKLKKSV